MNYVLITPARNEAQYIEKTIQSVIKQSVKPVKWVIVNDGSTDNTHQLIRERSKGHEWITIVNREDRGFRKSGGGVVESFNSGLEMVHDLNWQYIVKLDGDLELPQTYFESLLKKFQESNELGIASGVYMEKQNGNWIEISMPSYHAAGASKIYRRETFESIGGLVSSEGWDTVDEIKAMHQGWKTGHFRDIKFFHLKNEGSALGLIYTNQFHGRIYYITGGSIPFFVLKVIRRMVFGKPFFVAGLMTAIGYLKASISGAQLLVTPEEGRLYRDLLNNRMKDSLSITLGGE